MLFLNMESEIPWERRCKTCNTSFSSESSCTFHIRTYGSSHILESKKEANDRIFKSLASNFTNSLQKHTSSPSSSPNAYSSTFSPSSGASVKRPGSKKDPSSSRRQSASSSSPNRKRKNLVFTSTSTVPTSVYKDNYKVTHDLVFISDDQESFETIYGPENSDTNEEKYTLAPSSRRQPPYQQQPPPPYCSSSISSSSTSKNFQPPPTAQPSCYSSSSLPKSRSQSSFTRSNAGSSISTGATSRPNTGRSSSSLMNNDDVYYPTGSYFTSSALGPQPSSAQYQHHYSSLSTISQQPSLLPYAHQKSQFPPQNPSSNPPQSSYLYTAIHSAGGTASQSYLASPKFSHPGSPAAQSSLPSTATNSPAIPSDQRYGNDYLGPAQPSLQPHQVVNDQPITLPSIRQLFPESDFFEYDNKGGNSDSRSSSRSQYEYPYHGYSKKR